MLPDTVETPASLLLHHLPAGVRPTGGDAVRERPMGEPPTTLIRVTTWEDPVLAHSGTDPRGAYSELFWLPVVGPSGLWLLRRLAEHLDAEPDGMVIDPAEMACGLGIGGPGSRHNPLARAIERLERFGLARRPASSALQVRRKVGLVPRHRLERLPHVLQERHAAWEVRSTANAAVRQNARTLAADLATLGEGADAIERRLLRSGMHPALAYDAATWAAEGWTRLAGTA